MEFPFSRVGLSITVFTLFSTAAYVLRYVQQSKILDETNRELKHRRDRLTFLAYHNDLTQMPNKQAFIRDIDGFLSRSESWRDLSLRYRRVSSVAG
jgi:PleD family two-component response regulator